MLWLLNGGGDLGWRRRLYGGGLLYQSLVRLGGGYLLESLGTGDLGAGVFFHILGMCQPVRDLWGGIFLDVGL